MTKISILGAEMKINELNITNVGNITDLALKFNSNMNVICGTNGIGKTTILNSIAACFSDSGRNLKKKYGSNNGVVEITFQDCNQELSQSRRVDVNAVTPIEEYKPLRNETTLYRDLIHFSVVRNIDYKELDSLSKYPNREYWYTTEITKNGISDNQLKSWLVNRYLSSGHWEDLESYEQENYNLMKNVFSIINPDIRFKKADTKNYEILLEDRGSEVYFEFESAGYKAIVFILLGIISEIEFRTTDNKIPAAEFDGVILIDEIDMHLHPAWQREIVRVLKETFPNAQFIITTHSPSVLQDLENNEIIPLELDENKDVRIKDLSLTEYGLKGWTLEEILSDVMGVKYSKSKLYMETKHEFEIALTNEDTEKLKKAYTKLNTMLHPTNPLRQVLEIQMVGIDND
ncbi:AAA family ATPase [Enterococcus sp. AZ103]|uniref:AAA family ATPase n=1 Tax=Enterococcus sp. AZ103 TaxID=2774628 RepID=UPI003F294A5B